MPTKNDTIPNEMVPQTYRIDPVQDTVIPTYELRVGMVILDAQPERRGSPEFYSRETEYGRSRIFETARWCKIIEIKPLDPSGRGYSLSVIYADGVTKNRYSTTLLLWIVKTTSIHN